jgi:spore coat protein A
VPTVVHLHGGRTPHDSDGYPTDYVYPTDMTYLNQQQAGHESMGSGMMSTMQAMPAGDTANGTRSYTYPLEQRAAALWYHDHRMDFTGPSVWRGLAGFHFVRDDEEDGLNLPSGQHELPLMIVDRSFDEDGQLWYPSTDPSLVGEPGVTGNYVAGVLGDVMLVNGTPWPTHDVDQASYRLRLLNASNARRLSLRLDPPPASGGFVQIGTDGGLLAAPVTLDHIELAPAQRFDVIVDFTGYAPGTTVTMVNDFGQGAMSNVMQFVVGAAGGPAFTVPATLSTIEPLTAAQAVTTRSFRFATGTVNNMPGWLIGGRPFTPDDIAASVALGSVEVWELFADLHHPVHIHLSPFQVLSRGSNGPGPFDAGWKDTIDLNPGEQARIAIRFDGYPGKYVFHCHNLEHEDMAMMANFVTL